MMLDHLGLNQGAERVEKAIRAVVKNGIKDLTAGKMGYSTQEVGDLVVCEFIIKRFQGVQGSRGLVKGVEVNTL